MTTAPLRWLPWSLTIATVGLVLVGAQSGDAVSWLSSAVGLVVALYLLLGRHRHPALVLHDDTLPAGDALASPQTWPSGPALGMVTTLVVARWRVSTYVERRQLRWLAHVALLIPLFVVGNSLITLFGLGEPHRTVIVTITAYLVPVLLLRLTPCPLTGRSDLAVAGSTLAVAGLFRPGRARIKRLVDRRSFRARYDPQPAAERLSSRLRDLLDVEAMSSDRRSVVHRTMRPEHVSTLLPAPSDGGGGP